MAEINLKYFDGNNYYSDGNIENYILDMVKNGRDYSKIAEMDELYPIIYHLSPERENILNWYPFHKTDEILEIGAGCGAITGLLCRNAGSVTSVELSMRRSEINYERNKNFTNLEIIVGNFNDIDFGKKFDYVILNGVFEYAMSFSDSEEPYIDLLNNIIKKLKPAGKVLLAIENRLGIKYFTGAMEDHTNDYFVGLNGYKGNNTVRTFSKKELEDMFIKCGILNWKYYYPYPDYKFPTEIFCDKTINGSNYGRIYRNYQKGKLKLIDELEISNVLKKEGVMDIFSNSFLVEIMNEESIESNILYAKMNSTRRTEYRIATIIFEDDGKRFVKKIPLIEEAKKHIKQIFKNQQNSLPEFFEYLQGNLVQDEIYYPYLYEDNLDTLFQRYMEEQNKEAIRKIIFKIYKVFMLASSKKSDIYNEEFVKCFGVTKGKQYTECITGCNIDVILDNLYFVKEKYIVIDAEWILDFWIPTHFILWRMLNEWYSKYEFANVLLPKDNLYKQLGIYNEDIIVYRNWAMHFANHYVSNYDLDECVIQPLNIDLKHYIELEESENWLTPSLYVDYGDGFNENNKYNLKTKINEDNFHIKYFLDNSKMIKGLRWDPIEFKACRCKIEKCRLDGKEIEIRPINSESTDDTLFLTLDPQFVVCASSGYFTILELEGHFQALDTTTYLEIINESKYNNESLLREKEIKVTENNKLKQHNNILLSENEINRIENSKLHSLNVVLKQELEKQIIEKDEINRSFDDLSSRNKEIIAENEKLKSQLDNFNPNGNGLFFKTHLMKNVIKRIK